MEEGAGDECGLVGYPEVLDGAVGVDEYNTLCPGSVMRFWERCWDPDPVAETSLKDGTVLGCPFLGDTGMVCP